MCVGGVSEVWAGPRGRRWARAAGGAASGQVRSAEPCLILHAGGRRGARERPLRLRAQRGAPRARQWVSYLRFLYGLSTDLCRA